MSQEWIRISLFQFYL